MIFAHGPWWSEWHHVLPWLIIAFPTIGAWVAVWRSMFKNRKEENESQHRNDECVQGGCGGCEW